MNGRWAAVICAAGVSRRFAADGGLKKEYRPLPGAEPLTVLGACAAAFAAIPPIDTIAITIPAAPGAETEARRALPPQPAAGLCGASPAVMFVPGGATRRESVHHALAHLAGRDEVPDYVLIHDGARPWVSGALIAAVMDAVRRYGAALPVLPVTETPKLLETAAAARDDSRADGIRLVKTHLRRADVAAAQTPQGFRFAEYLRAMEQAAEQERAGIEFTDDAEIWGKFCGPVAAVPGDAANRKITYPGDLA